MKQAIITTIAILVFPAMLAFIPLDILGIIILVMFAIVFIVIVKQDIDWKKEEKAREEFYKKLCN